MKRLLPLMFLLIAEPALATLQAQVDRNVVNEGASIQLSLESDAALSGDPDLTPLEKDFDILGRSQSRSMRIINGVTSASTQWQLTLMPKRAGMLEIPALHAGNDVTTAIQVEVKPAGTATPQANGQTPDLFLEVDATPAAPFVQQQVNYTVRLFQGVDLRDAAISEPKPENGVVESLGQPVVYEAERQGRRYRVTEQRYALFPQKSGPLHLDGPLFRGGIPERSRRTFPNDLLGGGLLEQFLTTTRPVNLRGQAVELNVRPAPPQADPGPWLPAKSVKLSESWSPNPPEFIVGEPVTRTLTITALGLSPSQLPEFTLALPSEIQVYPDQPQVEAQVAATDVLGVLHQKFALIPSTTGEVTLPEIRVPWWDTTTDQPKVATLPARTLSIQPGKGGTTPKPVMVPPPIQTQTQNQSHNQAQAPVQAPSPSAPAAPSPDPAGGGTPLWPWLLGLGWAATVAAWLWDRRRRQSAPPPATTPSPMRVRDPLPALRESCARHDARATRDLLLAWGQGRWPQTPPRSLPELASRCSDPAVRAALEHLDRALYGQATPWRGDGFPETLRPLLTTTPSRDTPRQPDLPPLHPA